MCVPLPMCVPSPGIKILAFSLHIFPFSYFFFLFFSLLSSVLCLVSDAIYALGINSVIDQKPTPYSAGARLHSWSRIIGSGKKAERGLSRWAEGRDLRDFWFDSSIYLSCSAFIHALRFDGWSEGDHGTAVWLRRSADYILYSIYYIVSRL